MTKNRKGTHRRGSYQGRRIPPPVESPTHTAGRSPPLSPSLGPEARAPPGPPLTRPFALTPGPSAPTLGPSALTPRRSAPTQGSPGISGAPPQSPPGMFATPPRSPPYRPSPPRALARQRSLTLLHTAPPLTSRSPWLPGPETHGERTLADAQAQPPGRAPFGGSGTCGMTSPSDSMKNKHAKATKMQR